MFAGAPVNGGAGPRRVENYGAALQEKRPSAGGDNSAGRNPMSDMDVIWERLRGLMKSQSLGVLSTRIGPQPYSNLVAFATDEELRQIYFATTRATRKYDNVLQDPQVSFLVDDRNNTIQDFHRTSVATALGLVEEVKETGRESFMDVYLKKHPILESFVRSPNCAHLKIKVTKYIVVARFQNVFEIEI
jgi:nitroimidazol reductase NimA-like FMN-containing flavoprotein (pyridoxamine 5'-phosphate oxidase superfamily)